MSIPDLLTSLSNFLMLTAAVGFSSDTEHRNCTVSTEHCQISVEGGSILNIRKRGTRDDLFRICIIWSTILAFKIAMLLFRNVVDIICNILLVDELIIVQVNSSISGLSMIWHAIGKSLILEVKLEEFEQIDAVNKILQMCDEGRHTL